MQIASSFVVVVLVVLIVFIIAAFIVVVVVLVVVVDVVVVVLTVVVGVCCVILNCRKLDGIKIYKTVAFVVAVGVGNYGSENDNKTTEAIVPKKLQKLNSTKRNRSYQPYKT